MELVPVSKLATQIRGVTYAKGDAIDTPRPGYVMLLRANNIGEHGLETENVVYVPESRVASKQRLLPGDIVIAASSGSLDVVGKAARVIEPLDATFGAFCKVVRPGKGVNSSYLASFFQTEHYRRTISRLAAGANINNLRNEHIDNLELPLPYRDGKPDEDEQKRIAAVLDKADALRRQRQESLQLTEKLLQSVFIDMFGDPVMNPSGWDTLPLEKLCEKIVDCPHSTPVYSETSTGFYCVRSSDIQNGKLDLASARQVSESVFKERIARHEPSAGEVIYTREGGRLGFAAQVPQGKRICLGQRMMLFKARKDVSTNTFLANLLNSEGIRRKVLNLVGGGAAPRVNIKDLKTLIVFQPPFELQERFEAFAASLQTQEESLAQSAKQAERLFGSIQQRAFRGELDLSRLVLDPAEDRLTRIAPTNPITKPRKPKTAVRFLETPPALEPSLKKLDRTVQKGDPIPWSLDYFKFRILAVQPRPFSFSDLMQKAEAVFEEPPPYETIRDLIFDLLGQDGKPAFLRQRFDLQTDEESSEITGRKEIVFEPVS
ncbi:restriction endonuclease subunit S [Luteolibacter pohnpeiensis]|nr:restriction endonuclease subunit S [Luteolibacter pohnpeiensis]